MIYVDYKDRRPVYEQIVERFQELVLKGVLEPDSQVPSVRNLAMELSINPNTVQRAYIEMERRGIIYSVKGRGSFIAEDKGLREQKKEEVIKQLRKLIMEAYELGVSKGTLEEEINSIRGNLHD